MACPAQRARGTVAAMAIPDHPHPAAQPRPESHPVVGTWRLVSYDVVDRSTGERIPAMGDRPAGYTIFSGEGRVWFMLTADGREPGDSERHRAQLLETLIAYTGRYRIEGDDWVTAVDVAWNPAWVGTEQRRQFVLDGDTLQVLTPWRVMPNWPDRGETRSIITFERVAAD